MFDLLLCLVFIWTSSSSSSQVVARFCCCSRLREEKTPCYSSCSCTRERKPLATIATLFAAIYSPRHESMVVVCARVQAECVLFWERRSVPRWQLTAAILPRLTLAFHTTTLFDLASRQCDLFSFVQLQAAAQLFYHATTYSTWEDRISLPPVYSRNPFPCVCCVHQTQTSCTPFSSCLYIHPLQPQDFLSFLWCLNPSWCQRNVSLCARALPTKSNDKKSRKRKSHYCGNNFLTERNDPVPLPNPSSFLVLTSLECTISLRSS